MESGLNKFQIECDRKLEEGLRSKGFELRDKRTVQGDHTFLEGRAQNLRIWIYQNGADAASDDGKIDLRFEGLDFKSQEELIQTFVSEVLNHIR